MFRNVFFKNLKILLRDKTLVFWMLIFPIILSSIFYLAFSNIMTVGSFNTIQVGVVEQGENQMFSAALGAVSNYDDVAEDTDIFSVVRVSSENGETKLLSGEITAIITIDSTLKMTANASGVNQSVINAFLSDFNATMQALNRISGQDPNAMNEALAGLTARSKTLSLSSPANGAANDFVVFFYSQIAMTCFYFALAGINLMNVTQSNQSECGARVCVSGYQRTKLFLTCFLAYFIVCLAIIFIVIGYMALVLRIDFSSRWYFVLLTAVIGTAIGLMFGIFLGALFRKKSEIKTVIVISFTMLCSLLAGMMVPGFKYMIIKNLPILNLLNPLALITDCLYSIYYYTTLTQFFIYLGILMTYTAVLVLASVLLIRRKKYASV